MQRFIIQTPKYLPVHIFTTHALQGNYNRLKIQLLHKDIIKNHFTLIHQITNILHLA